MKLGKTIVVTGILFSSILGGVNVGSITAMAAGAPASTVENNTKKVTINMTDQHEQVTQKEIDVPNSDTEIIVKDSDLGTGYRLTTKAPKSQVIKVNGKINTVDVNVTKLKTVSVSYTINGKTNDSVADLEKTVQIADDENKVRIFELNIPSTYSVADNETIFTVKNNSINVNLKSKEETSSVTKPVVPGKVHSSGRYVVQRVRITFINKATNEEVGHAQLVGLDTFTKKFQAPTNYTLDNAADGTIKFNKKGNRDLKIFVNQVTPVPVKHEGVITTIDGNYKRLYKLDGHIIKNRALSSSSAWYTDQYATINGETMYRVATNEWVKAADILNNK